MGTSRRLVLRPTVCQRYAAERAGRSSQDVADLRLTSPDEKTATAQINRFNEEQGLLVAAL